MERRREPRFTANQPARLTVLGSSPESLEATLVDMSGRGMRFAHQRPLAPGTPLKVELGDSLILAEVAFTAREGDRFVSGVRVDQVLSRLSELMRLHKKLLAAAPASSKAGARVSVSNDAMLPLDARS